MPTVVDILLDTNVLLRMEQEQSDQYPQARQALDILFADPRLNGCIVPQILVEYWTVCTRPESSRGGFGWSCAITMARMAAWEKAYMLLEDPPGIHAQWKALVSRYNVMGKNAHDTKLVATMLGHDITRILTFNVGDFQRFAEIEAVHPEAIGEVW